MTGLHLAVDGSGLARPLAGVGTYTREIIHAMAVDRPDCRFTVFLPPGAQPLEPGPSIAHRRIPATRFLGRHVQWSGALRRLGADAYFGAAGQAPLGGVAGPMVLTIHDLAIYRNPDWFPPGQSLSTRWIVPRSIRAADRLVAVSTQTSADLQELFGVPASRIDVVHHGVARRFRPLGHEELQGARVRLGLPERFVLFVSTIEPRKNLDSLLDAWVQLKDRPDLVVAGSWGWRYEPIREKIERLGGRCHVIGAVDAGELPYLYNLALVLAHPAWYEGFGLTPLEAMACGTPVIVSDRASLPEVVADAGLVVAAADVDAWRRALERVLSDTDLAAGMRSRGILRAAEFGWDRAAAGTWASIDRALATHT